MVFRLLLGSICFICVFRLHWACVIRRIFRLHQMLLRGKRCPCLLYGFQFVAMLGGEVRPLLFTRVV